MNNKIIISISVIITIVIIAFSLTQNEMTEKPTPSQIEETNEMTEKPTLFELFLNTFNSSNIDEEEKIKNEEKKKLARVKTETCIHRVKIISSVDKSKKKMISLWKE